VSSQYQVCLYVGGRPEVPASRYIDLTPTGVSVEDILETFSALELTAADLRARTLFVASGDNANHTALVYSALIGFAGRRLDFSDGLNVFEATSLHAVNTRLVEELIRPDDIALVVQVGNAGPEGLPHVAAGTELSSTDIELIRYAKRLRLSVSGMSCVEALSLLIAVAALRQRGGADRLPSLVIDAMSPVGDEDETDGIDLDLLRRSANELRRSRRIDDRAALVDPIEVTSRVTSLRAAADIPIEQALLMLGSHQDETTGYWRCPRPDRHRNGDSNPSLKVSDAKVRCYRCDAEPLDALRLVIDTLGCTPDDAARVLVSQN